MLLAEFRIEDTELKFYANNFQSHSPSSGAFRPWYDNGADAGGSVVAAVVDVVADAATRPPLVAAAAAAAAAMETVSKGYPPPLVVLTVAAAAAADCISPDCRVRSSSMGSESTLVGTTAEFTCRKIILKSF